MLIPSLNLSSFRKGAPSSAYAIPSSKTPSSLISSITARDDFPNPVPEQSQSQSPTRTPSAQLSTILAIVFLVIGMVAFTIGILLFIRRRRRSATSTNGEEHARHHRKGSSFASSGASTLFAPSTVTISTISTTSTTTSKPWFPRKPKASIVSVSPHAEETLDISKTGWYAKQATGIELAEIQISDAQVDPRKTHSGVADSGRAPPPPYYVPATAAPSRALLKQFK